MKKGTALQEILAKNLFNSEQNKPKTSQLKENFLDDFNYIPRQHHQQRVVIIVAVTLCILTLCQIHILNMGFVVIGAPCPRAKFPKVLGGTVENTNYYSMDYHEYSISKAGIVGAGLSSDTGLLGYTVSGWFVPIFSMFGGPNSDDLMSVLWQKSIAEKIRFAIYGIVFNTDGSKLVATTYNYVSADGELIVFDVVTGNLEIYRTFSGAVRGYDYNYPNLIMGMDRIIIQTQSGDYHFVPTPYRLLSVPYPFSTTGFWAKESNANGNCLGLRYGATDDEFISYGTHSDKFYLAKYSATTGDIREIYGYSSSTFYQASANLDFMQISPSVSVIVAAIASYRDERYFSRNIFDSSVPSRDYNVYSFPGQAQFTNEYIQAVQIINKDQARCLEVLMQNPLITFLIQLSFSQLTAVFYRIFPNFSNNNIFSPAVFSQNKIGFGGVYVSIMTASFNKGIGGTLSFGKSVALLLSTDENESCYLAGSPVLYDTKTITLESTIAVTDLSALNLMNALTTVTFTDIKSSLTVKNIVTANTVSIDTQCPQMPYQFDPKLPQFLGEQIVLYGKTQIISPKMAILKDCDTANGMPTMIYSTLTDLPTDVTLNTINGDITVKNTVAVGKYPITIVYQMNGLMQKTSVSLTINVIKNSSPIFTATLQTGLKVALNSNSYVTLPSTTDADGDAITITSAEQGKLVLPSFVSVVSLSSGDIYSFSPTSFSEVGVHTIEITLADLYSSTINTFTIEVTNTAPYFNPSLTNQQIHIDQLSKYILPAKVDDEGSTITVSNTVLPPFASLVGNTINFTPSLPAHLGKSTCKIDLSDSQKAQTYSFDVTVINDPPQFAAPLTSLVTVPLNSIVKFSLPTVTDFEGHPITITTTLSGQPSLPAFIMFSQATPQSYYDIAPISFLDVRFHSIEVKLADPYSSQTTYFKVEVTNSPPVFDTIPKDIVIYLGIVSAFSLPKFHDPEGHSVSVQTNEFSKTSLPSFVSFNPTTFTYSVFTSDALDIGTYQIEVVLSDPQLKSPSQLFNINVQKLIFTGEQKKRINKLMNIGPPKFVNWKINTTIILKAETAFEFQLPIIEDPDNDEYRIKIKYGEAFAFTEYKDERLLFSPTLENVREKPFFIKITLEDKNKYFIKKSEVYTIKIYVKYSQDDEFSPFNIEEEDEELSPLEKIIQEEAKASLRPLSISIEGLLKLKSVKPQYNDILQKINEETIKIYLVKYQRKKEVNFTMLNITKDILPIQLHFDDPQIISARQDCDQIQLYFIKSIKRDTPARQRILQTGKKQIVLIKRRFTIKFRIPTQIMPGSSISFPVIKKAIGVASYIEFTNYVVLNMLLCLFLSITWSQLHDMSQLTLLSLLSLNIPGNVQSIIAVILNFVYLDIFFSDAWLLNWFDFDPENDTPITPQFDDIGFFSMNLVANLGTGFILLAGIALIFILQQFGRVIGRWITLFKQFSLWFDRRLKWSFYIGFFYYQFQPLWISSFINLYSLRYTTIIEFVSSIISFVFIPGAILFIFFVARQLRKHQYSKDIVGEELFQQMIEGISLKTRFTFINWNIVMIIRQALIILVLIIMRDYVVIQIQLLLIIALLIQIIIIHTLPFTSTLDNAVLILNEILISFYLYIIIILTYFADPLGESEENDEVSYDYIKLRQLVGWSLLGIFLLTVTINLTAFVTQLYMKIMRTRRMQILCRSCRKSSVVKNKQKIYSINNLTNSTVNIGNSFQSSQSYDPNNLYQRQKIEKNFTSLKKQLNANDLENNTKNKKHNRQLKKRKNDNSNDSNSKIFSQVVTKAGQQKSKGKKQKKQQNISRDYQKNQREAKQFQKQKEQINTKQKQVLQLKQQFDGSLYQSDSFCYNIQDDNHYNTTIQIEEESKNTNNLPQIDRHPLDYLTNQSSSSINVEVSKKSNYSQQMLSSQEKIHQTEKNLKALKNYLWH